MGNLELQQLSRNNYICSQRKPRLNSYAFTPSVKNLQRDSFLLFLSKITLELQALSLLNSSFHLTKYPDEHSQAADEKRGGKFKARAVFSPSCKPWSSLDGPLRREQELLAQSSLSSHLQLKITFSGLWWSLWTNNCPQLLFISTLSKKTPSQT